MRGESGIVRRVVPDDYQDIVDRLACYDLIAPDVLGSPPWLAVRHTAWSDIVRPHFTNVRRTMFRTLG